MRFTPLLTGSILSSYRFNLFHRMLLDYQLGRLLVHKSIQFHRTSFSLVDSQFRFGLSLPVPLAAN